MAMITTSQNNDSWRTDPLYTIAETAHLAHVSSMTIRRWLYGYQTDTQEVPPLLGERKKTPLVSFLQFAEILIASSWRRNNVPIPRIRLAHDFAKKEFGVEYPFASLDLEPLGGHILHRFDEETPGASLATLDTRLQQWTLPGFVIDRIHQFDYEQKLAARWYPVGKGTPIVVDPRISAGLPTILNRRVTIQTIYKRFKEAKYSIPFIASDLKLPRNIVEEAVRLADEVKV